MCNYLGTRYLWKAFARFDPKQFEARFLQWFLSMSKEIRGVNAVDGKRCIALVTG